MQSVLANNTPLGDNMGLYWSTTGRMGAQLNKEPECLQPRAWLKRSVFTSCRQTRKQERFNPSSKSMQIAQKPPNSRGAGQSELFAQHRRLFAVAGTGFKTRSDSFRMITTQAL
jgi:hypothetical protein